MRPATNLTDSALPVALPFWKSAGGKGRAVKRLQALLPADVHQRRWVEPFIGGGAMLFAMDPRLSLTADANGHLINLYKQIAGPNIAALLRELEKLQLARMAAEEADADDDTAEEADDDDDADSDEPSGSRRHVSEHYYAIRSLFNKSRGNGPIDAARLMYLNRCCFNGLYRESKAGEFNVPVGDYKTVVVLDEPRTMAARRVLKTSAILHANALDLLADSHLITPSDFVYLDPPYAKVRPDSFTQYTADESGDSFQVKLAEACAKLTERGVQWMQTNADTPRVRELYDGYNISELSMNRAINSKASGRGRVTELVIRNYGEKA